jgi:hypothetical protein
MPAKAKYSAEVSRASDTFIPHNLPASHADLIRASLSTSSWNKHLSAYNCLKEFQTYSNTQVDFPLSKETICNFVAFAASKKNLKHSTIENYISSFKFFHKLREMDSKNCNNFIASSMLKGVKNLDLYTQDSKRCRKVMTYPLLKILSHKVASESWSENDKQTIWTIFTVAFFGSFRKGELVPQNKKSYNEKETLLWEDIKFVQDFVVIRLKITKCKTANGEYVDLFVQESNRYCPVKALSRLMKLKSPVNLKNPVFSLDDGSFLTCKIINGILQKLLVPVIGSKAKDISAHSFRGALPSLLASHPDIVNAEDIRCWGRWSSSGSHGLYTRLKTSQKRSIYNKIINALNRNLSGK